MIFHDILGAAAVVALVTDFFISFDTSPAGLSSGVFAFIIVALMLFCALMVYLAIKASILRPKSGIEAFLGEEGVARERTGPDGGLVFVHGELWMAFCDNEIPEGTKVRVTGIYGLKLKVEAI
ncbi:MAG: NfeD family protein [Dissulfurimicrobium sp.]|uniref:NfeD family protein n=1 Tax=Dissulfurimicrobium sp. TaxID=2022436 RepID=UPI00404B4ED8